MLKQSFWKKYFQTYDILNSAIPYRELLEKIVQSAEVKNGDLIFDAGSGTGNLAIKLKECGASVVGFDFSEEGIKIHKSKDAEAEAIAGNLLERLPFSDNYFDKIVSNNVIYTLDPAKRKNIFKEFYRIIKPGGTIVLSNIGENFSPFKIFVDHLKKSLKINGLIKTIGDLFKYFVAMIKLFYFNYLIKKENSSGFYGFMKKGEQSRLLGNAGFRIIRPTQSVYSGQSYLDVGKK